MENSLAYRVTASWEGGRKGAVEATGIAPAIHFSAPSEFQGAPGYWTPEHFLVAKAHEGCLIVRSLICPVRFEPFVRHAEEVLAQLGGSHGVRSFL
jgi:organic hydroperoxide reductase OsmC/OhrA